jgi:N-acetylmuramoyl-L-alanine amidase
MPEGTAARVSRESGPGAAPRLVLELGATASARPATAASPPAAVSPAAVPAAPVAPVRAAHAPPQTGREIVVAIDAGHGGQDPGAIGPAGTREKDVVLKIARELAGRVNREPGMRAVLTRDGDYFLSLRQRMRRARDARADIFVSVHADAVLDRSVSGSSVYVLSEKGATDEQARWLAERENAADLSQSASIASSMEAAERVLRALGRVNTVRKPAVQQAGFVVLKSPDIPSMLVETAFISNPGDEQLLRREGVRTALAEAIFRGVHAYFTEHPPEGTRFALERREQSVTARNLR